MVRSDLCDYSDAHLVVEGIIDLEVVGNNAVTENGVVFKDNALFRSCVSKTNNTFIDNAEDLDIVMPMCNLLEYSGCYSMTSGSLWNYYRDEVDDVNDDALDSKS